MEEVKGKMVSIPTLITMLRNDIVKFVFEKKDGSERIAFGTRNPKIISAVIGTVAAKSGTVSFIFVLSKTLSSPLSP